MLVRSLVWLALALPALTLSAPRPVPDLQILIPLLTLIAISLILPARFGFLKLAIALPLTLLLLVVGSQLPSTIVVLGFVLAEIAVERSTRDLAWCAGVSVATVAVVGLMFGEVDNLRPLWLVHSIGLVMFVALGIAIRERRALVEETKHRLAMSETAHRVQVAEAITQERLNISRELHNRLGHQLTVISLNSEAAKQSKQITKELRLSLEVIGQSARHSLDEISVYLESLRDKRESLDQSDLLGFKFTKFRELGLEVKTSVDKLPHTDNHELLDFLDSAIDELLMNALKYSSGSVEYHQTFKANNLVLDFVNETNTAKVAPSMGGFGLQDISYRAAQLGALFERETSGAGLFKASLTFRGWN